ncbi:MAG: hypothetical protein ACRDTG_00705 [Pseudonocardiaceae bacterium]
MAFTLSLDPYLELRATARFGARIVARTLVVCRWSCLPRSTPS